MAGSGAESRTYPMGADARYARHGGIIPHPGAVKGVAARTRPTGADARSARHGGVFRILVRRGAESRTYPMGGDARGARYGDIIPHPGAATALRRGRVLREETRAMRATVALFRILVRQRRCGQDASYGSRRAVRATVAFSASCCGIGAHTELYVWEQARVLRATRCASREGRFGLRAAQRWPSGAPLAASIDRGERPHEATL